MKKGLKRMEAGKATLFVISSMNYGKKVVGIFKKVKEHCSSGIVIACDSSFLSEEFGSKNFYCIDINKTEKIKNPRVKFVTPNSWTEVGIVFTQTLKQLQHEGKKFVFFDLNTTLPNETSLRFLNFLINIIRLQKLFGVFLIPKEEQLSKKISEFFDVVEEIKQP